MSGPGDGTYKTLALKVLLVPDIGLVIGSLRKISHPEGFEMTCPTCHSLCNSVVVDC